MATKMKTIKTLIDAALNGTAEAHKGNHGFIRVESRNIIVFYGHSGRVCTVDISNKTFKLNHCGYDTYSTTRTLNAYRDELTARGFTCSPVK